MAVSSLNILDRFSIAEAKKAAAVAATYFKDLFPEYSGSFRLEEIIRKTGRKPYWAVTFGYKSPEMSFDSYKVVNLEAQNHRLLGITMRE
jgi:hypothetical protein